MWKRAVVCASPLPLEEKSTVRYTHDGLGEMPPSSRWNMRKLNISLLTSSERELLRGAFFSLSRLGASRSGIDCKTGRNIFIIITHRASSLLLSAGDSSALRSIYRHSLDTICLFFLSRSPLYLSRSCIFAAAAAVVGLSYTLGVLCGKTARTSQLLLLMMKGWTG